MNTKNTLDFKSLMFKSSPSINHLEVVELSRNINIDFPPLDDDFRIVDDDEDIE